MVSLDLVCNPIKAIHASEYTVRKPGPNCPIGETPIICNAKRQRRDDIPAQGKALGQRHQRITEG
jgi:hypothetical protein